jgi:tripartite-type tricarboxylate transporter receptor subunit TctC
MRKAQWQRESVRAVRALVAVAILAALLPGAAEAQKADEYPNKAIRIIAASTPGASIDIISRIAGNWLQTRWKQSVIVENRPGAFGVIAADVVAKSPPDGYTLLVYATSLAYQASLVKNVPYDWTRDITPVAMLAGSGYVMIVPADLPVKSLAEFIAYAKANPGKLNHGIAAGIDPDMEETKTRLGVQLQSIMYKGGAPLLAAIGSGEVQLMFGGVFQAVAMMQSGKARAIAYTGPKRAPALPDVPTLVESGYPGFTSGFQLAMFGPGGMPADIVAKLNHEISEMNKAPDTLERYKGLGYDAYDVSPDVMRTNLLEYGKRSAATFQRVGIKPE